MLHTASQPRGLPAATSPDLKWSWGLGSGGVSCLRSHPASSHKPQSDAELGDGEWGCELSEVPSCPHDGGQASPDTVTALHGHTAVQQLRGQDSQLPLPHAPP